MHVRECIPPPVRAFLPPRGQVASTGDAGIVPDVARAARIARRVSQRQESSMYQAIPKEIAKRVVGGWIVPPNKHGGPGQPPTSK